VTVSNASPRPVVVEVGELIRTHYRPFYGRARWSDGTVREVVVKPQRENPKSTREHLMGEWCGYTLAHMLGLPTPPAHIVEITAESLRPLGTQYADIVPGPAFATERMLQSFSLGDFGFPPPHLIRNIDSVSGMVVLDTIMWNTDREEDVLAVPQERGKFALSYIDNTWLYFFLAGGELVGRFPREFSSLAGLCVGLGGLAPYALAAMMLDDGELAFEIASAPEEFQDAVDEDPAEIAEELVERAAMVAATVERDRPAGI
jgi:hypothetical protein